VGACKVSTLLLLLLLPDVFAAHDCCRLLLLALLAVGRWQVYVVS